jgi:mono/diheme cytochrome c family protein
VAVACLLLAGCGNSASAGHSTSAPHPRPATISLPSTAPKTGAEVFAHDCQACHSLVGNESLHKQGGDLLGYNMTRGQLLRLTRVMPTRPLSNAQLQAVVDFVLRAQRRGHG